MPAKSAASFDLIVIGAGSAGFLPAAFGCSGFFLGGGGGCFERKACDLPTLEEPLAALDEPEAEPAAAAQRSPPMIFPALRSSWKRAMASSTSASVKVSAVASTFSMPTVRSAICAAIELKD